MNEPIYFKAGNYYSIDALAKFIGDHGGFKDRRNVFYHLQRGNIDRKLFIDLGSSLIISEKNAKKIIKDLYGK